MAFIDPPYNVGVNYGDGAKADRLPPEQYLKMIEGVVWQLVSKLTSKGSLWVLSPEKWADEIGSNLRSHLPVATESFGEKLLDSMAKPSFPVAIGIYFGM